MSDRSAAYVYSDLGADPDLGDLVDLFVGEMPSRIESLLRLYDENNRLELCRLVHQMKGAAGSYGFHAVTPLAARLEQSLKNDTAEEILQEELMSLVALCRRIRSGSAD
jgi:HPt (histidine-containing phosphotransfer) domain-containing protein